MVTLKVNELIERYGGGKNLHKIAAAGDANYPTLHRWKNADQIIAPNLGVLFQFLRGLGFSPEAISALPLGEVFDIPAPNEPEN